MRSDVSLYKAIYLSKKKKKKKKKKTEMELYNSHNILRFNGQSPM